jgi:hypothetical protein
MKVRHIAILWWARHDLKIRQIPHSLKIPAYYQKVDDKVIFLFSLFDRVIDCVELTMTLATVVSSSF